jgi:hypothetical protein
MTEAVHGEQEGERQQSKLRGVMTAIRAECVRVYREDHALKEPQLDGDVPLYWSPIDLDKVIEATETIAVDFAEAKTIVARVANGLSRVALGLFGTIGLHYTREMFTTVWVGKMMPNVFGVR